MLFMVSAFPSVYFILLFCSTLRQGIHDLRVWPGVEADVFDPTKTPGKQGASSDDVMDKLAKVNFHVHDLI